MCNMIHAVPLTGTIEEGVMISSWRRSWTIIVGTNMLIWVSLVSILLTLTMLLLHIYFLMYSSAFYLKRLSITILVQGQPDQHRRKLVGAHCLSLSGNVWNHISSRHEKRRVQNGIWNAYHKKARWVIWKMNKTWMWYLFHTE